MILWPSLLALMLGLDESDQNCGLVLMRSHCPLDVTRFIMHDIGCAPI
jgi:hypothetical protein